MKNYIFTAALFIGCTLLKAQNITHAEYFIDSDAGVGNNTMVTLNNPQPDGSYNLPINLAGVGIGYHKLYIRTRDSDGNWSITSRRNIEVISTTTTKKIIGGEYFFDSDPGVGAATPIAISPQDSVVLQNFAAVTSGLSIGYHKLYIRTKDNDGNWSLTGRRNVEVINTPISVIAGAEYFFNSDSGVGFANPVTFSNPLADGSFSFKIPIDKIPAGSNTLYIRVKDSVNNSWSITQWEKDSVVTSVKTGNWSDPATWSNNKIPDANTVVLLYHNIAVDIDATCKSLTPYRNNVTCNVMAGKALHITGQE